MVLRQGLRTAVVLAAGIVALVGCGRQEDDMSSDLKIVGGKEVPASQADERRWSTVALTTDYAKDPTKGSTMAQNHSFCSGTLIAPRVVVTAAHCIDEMDANTRTRTGKNILPKQTDFIVHFDVKVTEGGNWVRAKKVLGHQMWDPNQTLSAQPTAAANDIGLIILEKDAPSFAKPAKLATKVEMNEAAYLAGYGVTKSRNENDTGILRQVDVKVKQLDSTGKRIQVGEFFMGACAGDSGGPLYVKRGSSYEVAGATSTGAEIGGMCIGLMNNYTDTTNYKSWIETESAKLLD